MSSSGSSGRSRSTSAFVRNGSDTTGPSPGVTSMPGTIACTGVSRSLKRMAASTPRRRTGCRVTSAASSGWWMTSSKRGCSLRSARYSGSDRPAWRMNQTGVRDAARPLHAARNGASVMPTMLPGSALAGRVAQRPHGAGQRVEIAPERLHEVPLDALEVDRYDAVDELAALRGEHRLEAAPVARARPSLDEAGGLEPVDEARHPARAQPGAEGQVAHAQVLARRAGEPQEHTELGRAEVGRAREVLLEVL